MKIIRRGDAGAMARALALAASTQPTWNGDPTAREHPGFHTELFRTRVGRGDSVFADAVETVLTWGIQRGAGLTVLPVNPRVRAGDDVVVGLPVGPVMILAPCRVSDVFDSADRGGFRYVTLPGHPEAGFEEFVVEKDSDGEVFFAVRPVSRSASILTTLGGPVSRLVQRRATNHYLGILAAT